MGPVSLCWLAVPIELSKEREARGAQVQENIAPGLHKPPVANDSREQGRVASLGTQA